MAGFRCVSGRFFWSEGLNAYGNKIVYMFTVLLGNSGEVSRYNKH